jgi:hypothetical protein
MAKAKKAAPKAAKKKPVAKPAKAAAKPAKSVGSAKAVKGKMSAAKAAPPAKTASKTAPAKTAKPAAKAVTAKPVAAKAPAKTATPVAPKAAKAPAAAKSKAPKEVAPKESKAKEPSKKPVVEEAPVEAAETIEMEVSEEVVLTDAEGRRYCRVKDCDQLAMVDTYCRYHYLLYWKRIQVRKKILTEGKLERYIEELTARYPDKFLDMLRKDLRSEKEFVAAIQELEIDESQGENEFEEESENYIEEVRGISSEPSASGDDDF